MNARLIRRLFTASVILVLLLTAAGKAMALLSAPIQSDPAAAPGYLSLSAPYIASWTNADMMRLAVGFESLVLVLLACLPSDRSRLILIAWVGGVFAAYHLGLTVIDYREPCTCLGGPADWLRLSRRTYDWLTSGLVAYFLAGAYGLLLWEHLVRLAHRLWAQGNAVATRIQPEP